MQKVLIFMVSILILSIGCQKDNEKKIQEQIVGVWESKSAENLNGIWGYRKFTFTKTTWNLEFTAYYDPGLTLKVFKLHVAGPYEVIGEWDKIAGSYAADFGAPAKDLTLYDPSAETTFGFKGCGLVVGKAVDISGGCSFFDKVSDCPEEHDIIKLESDGTLFLGDRSVSLCQEANRPKTVGFPLIKK